MRVVVAVLSSVTAAMSVAWLTGTVPRRIVRKVRHRSSGRLDVALRRSGIDMTARRFWLVTVASGILVLAVVSALTGVVAVAVAPAAMAALGPRWWVARRSAARLADIQRAWPDAIRDLVASIGAGMSLNRALEELGRTGPIALRPVFSRYSMSARAVGVAPALQGVRGDLADPTSDRVVEVLLVAHERGGAMVSEILRDLAVATTRDLWLLDEIETESLEQRINARAVFVLPWMVLLAVTVQDGPFRDFYRSGAGVVVIVLGAIASGLGMAAVSRLGRQPAEPRVLVGGR